MNTDDRELEQTSENLYQNISPIVKQMKGVYNDALKAYTPQVNDICNKNASEKDVERMLDLLLDFCADERMLSLFKQVCGSYWHKYPNSIAFYIIEYRKWYDPKSLTGTEYEYLLDNGNADEETD